MPSDIYIVTDDRPVSLSEIVTAIRSANGCSPHLFAVNASFMRATLAALGLAGMAAQLFDDLVFEDSKLRDLGWQPPLPPLAARELAAGAEVTNQTGKREV